MAAGAGACRSRRARGRGCDEARSGESGLGRGGDETEAKRSGGCPYAGGPRTTRTTCWSRPCCKEIDPEGLEVYFTSLHGGSVQGADEGEDHQDHLAKGQSTTKTGAAMLCHL
ncbi:Os10g0570000 [Oryza sativa Japonica Group]|uniref:Os10g0570000 protein n=1 Tax=Oryza sativa subsp. japonica TaxID=39947 RepID=C7J7F6_ORYSJ|nr:Os10g0570000 [Oryza sativa Japonica Group]|eukprot:NP_001176281.1 Os10g0570000 [Oryza sativa Japonica Group]